MFLRNINAKVKAEVNHYRLLGARGMGSAATEEELEAFRFEAEMLIAQNPIIHAYCLMIN